MSELVEGSKQRNVQSALACLHVGMTAYAFWCYISRYQAGAVIERELETPVLWCSCTEVIPTLDVSWNIDLKTRKLVMSSSCNLSTAAYIRAASGYLSVGVGAKIISCGLVEISFLLYCLPSQSPDYCNRGE